VARILIACADEATTALLRDFFWEDGHAVMLASTAHEAATIARERRPEIAIVEHPMTGSEDDLLTTLRAGRANVVVMLHESRDAARLPGDVASIAEPFSLVELRARVESFAAPRAASPSSAIAFGALRVDRDKAEVVVDGAEIDLTELEQKLLLFLFDRRGEIQSRETLLHHVWGLQASVTTRTVDTHVKRLRQKLGVAADYVETVRGYGYRFVASI
jgi:two-component system phosphate regulon response regulator PhoB